MTLNELRDQLVEEYPGRTISTGAQCWFHPHDPPSASNRSTVFSAAVWRADGSGIECHEEAESLKELLGTVRAALAAPDDQHAIAEPEPELAT